VKTEMSKILVILIWHLETKVKLLLLCNVVENAALITVSLLTCC